MSSIKSNFCWLPSYVQKALTDKNATRVYSGEANNSTRGVLAVLKPDTHKPKEAPPTKAVAKIIKEMNESEQKIEFKHAVKAMTIMQGKGLVGLQQVIRNMDTEFGKRTCIIMNKVNGLTLEQHLKKERALSWQKHKADYPQLPKPFPQMTSQERKEWRQKSNQFSAKVQNPCLEHQRTYWLPKCKDLLTKLLQQGVAYTDIRDVNFIVSPTTGELTLIDPESCIVWKKSLNPDKNAWIQDHLTDIEKWHQRSDEYLTQLQQQNLGIYKGLC